MHANRNNLAGGIAGAPQRTTVRAPVQVARQTRSGAAHQSDTIQAMRASAKHHTDTPPILVDGKPVDRNLAREVLFENARFAPRDQFEVFPAEALALPPQFDHSNEAPLSMFGPMPPLKR